MANVTTDFNVNPYYDDYDEDKSYLRVLFRPGYAVQGRELTQLQTILQKQVSRFGDHMFKDGSPVLGGELTLDTEVSYLKLISTDTATTFNGGIISDTSAVAGAGLTRAKVLATVDAIGSDAPTLIVKFLSGTTFTPDDTIFLEGTATTGTPAATSQIGGASVVSINRGVYFVNGFFALVLAQTLILEKYSNTPTYRIGLTTTESIPTSDNDTSLVDPASGTTNANAPGANRFKIALTLAKKVTTSSDPVAANADSNFVELMRIADGIPTKHVKYPVYGALDNTLARRTYDESGDYTIKPFPIQVINHQGANGTTLASSDTTITGLLSDFENDFAVGDSIYLSTATTTYATVSSIANSTSMVVGSALGNGTSQKLYNRNRVSAALDPGKAYSKGYEYESMGTEYVDVKKAREVITETSFPINPNFGNSLKVTNFFGGSDSGVVFNPETISTTYDMHCVKKASLGTTATTYTSTKIGTTRLRQIDYTSGDFANVAVSNTAIFDMYIFDTQFNAITANAMYDTGSTTVILEGSKSSTVADAYNGAKISADGETRVIDDYTVTSNTATINLAFSTSSTTKSFRLSSAFSADPTATTIIADNATFGSAAKKFTITSYDSTELRAYGTMTLGTAFPHGDSIWLFNAAGTAAVGDGTSRTTVNTVMNVAESTINFSVREIESIAKVSGTYATTDHPYMDIDNSSKADINDATSNTKIFDTNLNSLVFPTGFENVKGIGSQSGTSFTAQGISFQRKETLDESFAASGGLVFATITSPSGTTFEVEGKGTGDILESPKANYIVVATADASGLQQSGTNATGSNIILKGQIIDCIVEVVATNQVKLTPRRNGTTFTAGTIPIQVYATCDHLGKTQKTKTRANSTTLTAASDISTSGILLNSSGTNTQQNNRLANGHLVVIPFTGTQSLQVADCIRVSNVIEALAAGSTAATQFAGVQNAVGNTAHPNNITSRYSFNDGQKDNFFDHGSITLKAGQTKPANNVLITFDNFTHSTTDGYACVDSYTNVDYADIPAFVSPISGTKKELRDSIDFRPIKSSNTSGTIQSNDSLPDADTNMYANVVYYLPRKDKLTLAKDRVFKVIEGISSENPILPADDEDAMTLYNLDIPAYTFDASEVDTQYIDNRRFTMRDIGKIEKRVDTLEYYTALSFLEKEANDLSIKDSATNSERFKNGLMVDSFNGHNIGDVSNADFAAAIDFEMKELRPPFSSDCFRFSHDSVGSSANTAKTGDLITLSYTTANAIVQPLASGQEGVNPYGTNQFNGHLTIDPPNDVWFDTSGRPSVLINIENLNDHWVQGNNNGFGRQWDDWSFTWSGVQVNDDNLIKNRKSTGTANTVSRFALLTSQNKTRTGIVSTKPPETIKRSIGNRTVSLTIIPYIREQKLRWIARGLKPNAIYYPYFDNTEVSANTKPAYSLTYTANSESSNSGIFNTQTGEQVTLTQTFTVLNQTKTATGLALFQNTSNILVSDISQEVTWSQITSGLTVGETITFANNTASATGTLQSANTSANSFTVNSISGTIATSMTATGTTTGALTGTVNDSGGLRTGQIFQGTGSAKANGNITNVGTSVPSFSGTLQADRSGNLAGELNLSPLTYRAGEKLFRLTDSSTDTIASTESVAEKLFRVQGMLESRSGNMSSTRPMDTKRENVKEKNTTQDTINRITTSSNWMNPLAQTFIVDKNENPNGIYASSVDIYFMTVDDTLPVTLQLRPVVNEFPSSSAIIPFSEITLNASDTTANSATPNVAVSTTATRFTFESPVYLYPDEYAIVLITPSTGYQVHTSTLGETVKNTTSTKVSVQPNVGQFYWPQNSSVWSPARESQLMFRVNRCNFSTGSHSVYLSANSEPLSGNTSGIDYDVFKLSTSELTFSNTAIAYSHKGILKTATVGNETQRASSMDSSFINLTPNKNVTLTAQRKFIAPSGTAGPIAYAANNYYLRAIFTSNDSKVSPAIDMSRINLITTQNVIDRAPLANSDFVVTNQGANGANFYSSAPTATLSGGGGTGASALTVTTSGTGDNIKVTGITITAGGSGYYETPTVTFSAGSAAVTVQNEQDSDGGNAAAKYISRRVNLEDGFDAQDIKVFLNAFKPKDTDIKVYFRVHNAEDPEDFEKKPYVLMTQETDINLISANETEINQYIFKTADSVISYTSGGVTYDKFKTFSIKIVLGSASSSIIPKIKDMKAIALDF